MRKELKMEDLAPVSGGTVRLNTTYMKIGFSELKQIYDVVNCTDDQALELVVTMYAQHKYEGDIALETATLEAFRANGWIA